MSRNPTALAPDRVVAIDALRGFDMLWIIGGKELVLGILLLFVSPMPRLVHYHQEHVAWIGFAAWDLIMPLFLFVVGAAMPFSLTRRAEEAGSLAPVYRKIARRFVLLWILGMFAQGHLLGAIVSLDITVLNVYSNTLQAIAVGYVIAALALLHLPRWGQAVLCAVLLIAYWALLSFVPFAGHAAGTLEPRANLALHIDEALMGQFADGTTYAWILAGLGFAGSVLLGVFAGHLLRSDRSGTAKLIGLIGMGLACLAGGAAWGNSLPIIKHLWTPSMVLWAAGWSYLLLAFFYLTLDLLQFRRWAFPFIVIGANAIVAYMVGEALVVGLADTVVEALGLEGYRIEKLAVGLLAIIPIWCGLYVMYRRRIFVRI